MRASTDGRDVGVAGDEPHVTELDAEPLRQELREARLVTLARRERAEHHVETALGAHGDLRALARRAGVELQVVRQADAAIAPAPPRLGAARLEAGPIGERHRAVLRRRVVAAVVEEADRVAVRHRAGRHQVASPQLHAVESVMACREVDQPLDDEHHLGPARAAIRIRG